MSMTLLEEVMIRPFAIYFFRILKKALPIRATVALISGALLLSCTSNANNGMEMGYKVGNVEPTKIQCLINKISDIYAIYPDNNVVNVYASVGVQDPAS